MKVYRYLAIVYCVIISSCSSGGSDDSAPAQTTDTAPPSAPTNLIVTSISTMSIDLSWTASTDNIGVKNYSIYKDDEALATISSTSHTASGLDANTTYSFKLKARDAAGNESGFSNVVNVKTDDDTAVLVTTSGDIEAYLGSFIDDVPGDSGNNYKIPLDAQLTTWDEIIDAILGENIDDAVLKSSEINYQINEFTDTSLTPNQVFYILEEKSDKSNYWGTYVFSKTPTINNLIIQAPHIKNDTNTGKQAVYCFKNNVAKAVFISGAHRCNNSEESTCSGTTSTCNSGSQPYRVSDLAHNINSVFQKTTENVFNAVSNSVFIQLHGFGKNATDPYVILSNGTRETPSIDYATQIKDALLVEDNSLTFKLAHIDTGWTRLIGFTNTQGRLINSSSNPCSASASETTGRFIHIEQERTKLRESADEWIKMSNALKSVFN
ncbi:fibronectin type III domain-containing protein [Jejuia spongiicola]|uniref:Fibronectin type III domain-containing protein n=1 Tax=Jejuia spongiicola TaxID=2942207 RepID=A0ABT0QAI9_9FLAO|nr:fibronectin type III domain-containing protein [Jejuia spongiicola]MCL6293999.1 fibronectin type III domain-containing protein [Jejuia spongiicola]